MWLVRVWEPYPPAGEAPIEWLLWTNEPVESFADALRVIGWYTRRWTMETGFQQLTADLRCEIDTQGYPRAALFGFATACVAYNAVAVVKGAIRAAQNPAYVEEELLLYYLALEVAQVTPGMRIAIPDEPWELFRTMSTPEFAATLLDLTGRLDRRVPASTFSERES